MNQGMTQTGTPVCLQEGVGGAHSCFRDKEIEIGPE